MASRCLPHKWRFKSDTLGNRTDNFCVVSPHAQPLNHVTLSRYDKPFFCKTVTAQRQNDDRNGWFILGFLSLRPLRMQESMVILKWKLVKRGSRAQILHDSERNKYKGARASSLQMKLFFHTKFGALPLASSHSKSGMPCRLSGCQDRSVVRSLRINLMSSGSSPSSA